MWFKVKKKQIFHILYIIVAPLCPAFLKRVDFYKAHRSEKPGVLWLASYPVRWDWPNASSVRRKCYASLEEEIYFNLNGTFLENKEWINNMPLTV